MPDLTLAIAAKWPFDAAPFWAALGESGSDLRRRIEIIVAHDGRESMSTAPIEGVAQIALQDAPVFALWGAAIARTRGDRIGIMDINAPPDPGWLAAMLEAIESGADVYYGPVRAYYAPGDPRVIGYLVEYVQFHPPIAAGMDEIPGNNIVVRRDLMDTESVLSDKGFSKTALLRDRARRVCAPPVRVDDATVDHRKPFAFGRYGLRRYRHGRCYAADRVKGRGLGERLKYAALTPLLPLVRVHRIWRHVTHAPRFRPAFFRFLPSIVAAESCWSFGELCGYLAGEGGCRELLD